MTRTTSFRSPRARFYRRQLLQYCQEHAFLLGLGLLYLLGVWVGTRIIPSLDPTLAESLTAILGGFVKGRSGQPIESTMLSAFTASFWPLLLLFVCGFCAIAAPLILFLPFFKGLGFGLTAASMLGIYGTAAVPYLGLLLLPNAVCGALVIVLGCHQSFRLSLFFLSLLRGERGEGETPTITTYCLRFLLLTAVLLAGAALEGVLFTTFSATLTPLI